jgi:hypothetical protein
MMPKVSIVYRMQSAVEGAMPEKNFENAKRIVVATVLTALCWAVPGCQSISPTSTYADIRFIDASPDAGGIDIYQGNTAVAPNLGFGTVSSYVPISPGTYRFTADTANTKQSLVSASAGIATGKQYTVLISNVAASLQETIFSDQSSSAPSGQIAIRVIMEAVYSGPYDVYMVPSGAKLITVNPILTNVTFNSIGSYIDIATGSYSVVIVPANTVLSSTTVATYTGTVTAYTSGSAHTIILLDNPLLTTPPVQVITTDDYEPPGSVAAS